LSGRSKNPKTAELQNVLDALDKAEAGRHRPQKGARVIQFRPKNSKPPRY
jgi:hypothetical protein